MPAVINCAIFMSKKNGLKMRDPYLSETPQKTPQEEKQPRVEFSFPILIIRTKKLSAVFDKLGPLRASKYISWLVLFIMPFVAGVALYLIINSAIAFLTNPAIGEITRELGPGSILLLPGINPIFPIFYGWIAIIVAIAIHEGAHGVIARNVGFRVKSSGLLFFLIIPIGAFVDVDEEQVKKAKPKESLKVMAAGVGGNIVLATVCLIGVLILVGGLTPAVNGVYFNDVTDGMPAQRAGLLPNDVLVSIDNVRINNTTELASVLGNKTSGDTVNVVVVRGEGWEYEYSTNVTLTVSDNRTVMGVSVGDLFTQERLDNYRTFSLDRLSIYLVPPTLASGLTPFSDSLAPFYTHWLGPAWVIVANGLFWLWFVNFNLAIFNALPIYPLDGGRAFNITLKKFAGKKLSEKTLRAITIAVTIAVVVLVLLVTVVPFIL